MTNKQFAYRTSFLCGGKMKHSKAFECYHCSNFYIRKERYERYIKDCSIIPGVLYNFDTQNLVTFEDNLKCKGDFRFVAYCNFETTTFCSDNGFPNTKNTKMSAVFYVIIFGFHPKSFTKYLKKTLFFMGISALREKGNVPVSGDFY